MSSETSKEESSHLTDPQTSQIPQIKSTITTQITKRHKGSHIRPPLHRRCGYDVKHLPIATHWYGFTRWIGDVLADALAQYSFDLIGLVASYLRAGTATQKAQPSLLFTVGNSTLFDKPCYHIACAPNGHLWISNPHKVHVFDRDGHLLFQPEFPALLRAEDAQTRSLKDNPLTSPQGMAFDDKGQVFVAMDFFRHVAVCNLQGQLLRKIKVDTLPHCLAWCNERLLLPNIHDADILIVNAASGALERMPVRENFYFYFCGGIACDETRRRIYVLGVTLNQARYVTGVGYQILVLDFQGNCLFTFRNGGTERRVSAPQSIAVDREGNILAADPEDRCVQIFSPKGQLITTFHDPVWPCVNCIAVDDEGKIWIGKSLHTPVCVKPAQYSAVTTSTVQVYVFPL